MFRLILFAGMMGSVACSFDPAAPAVDDSTDAAVALPDARVTVIDAGEPGIDATPVDCTSAVDCQTPPDLCHLPGQCNLTLNICQFPPRDCASLSDTCNAGVCDPASGACETTPINEGGQCDDPTFGGLSGCNFVGTCDLDGTQSRQRTDFACASGSCNAAVSTETRNCSRPPGSVTGLTCAPTTCGTCDSCTDPDPCEDDATCTRSCNDFECSFLGTCDPNPFFVIEDCTRDTDGDACVTCGAVDCECADGVCEDAD